MEKLPNSNAGQTPSSKHTVDPQKPLVLFDLDGTLIDSQNLVFETFRQVFAQKLPDYQLSLEELYSFFGPTLETTFLRYFPPEEVEDVIDLYQKINKDLHYMLLGEMPHALETVQKLYDEGYAMGILSNKRREPVFLGMEICHLRPYFEAVFAKEDQPACKPDPAGLLHAAKVMGYPKEKAVYVGDNAADIQAAHRAGFVSIGYTLDTVQRTALEKEGPDYLIDDLRQLPFLLKEESKWNKNMIL